MTKTELQKELLEKVKPGTKPSDIKKDREKNRKTDKSNDDEGYFSEEEKNIVPTNQQTKELESQIKSLNKQLKVYQDFKEADLKIKEKYKKEISDLKKQNQDLDYLLKTGKNSDIIKKLQQENKNLNKTIENLQKQVKNKGNNKGEIKKLFTCYHCQKQQELSLLVLEFPEGKLCQPCWQLLRKKTKENTKEKVTNQSFTCHNCQETKKETEYKVKLDATLYEYSICSNCLPLIKEYNEKEEDSNRELDIWE